jgi:AcrR family transcriptional regulator
MQATIDLVLSKGYAAITIQEITDQADLGYGTFYLHFKDKEDIVWSAIEEGVKATQSQVAQQFASIIPPQIEYYGYLNIFQHVAANQQLYRVMLGSKGSSLLTHRIQELLAADIHQHLQSGSADFLTDFDLPAEVIAQVLTGAITRTVLWWVEAPNSFTPEQMAGMLYKALHHLDPP